MCPDDHDSDELPPALTPEETFHTVYDGPPGTLSVGVIEAIAEATGIDRERTEVPLDRSVDPDALNDIFTDRHDGSARRGGHVVFPVWNLRVVVHNDGHIFVHPPDQ
jgi:hypothetical protein